MERDHRLIDGTARESSYRDRIIMKATALGIGIGTAALIVGVGSRSPVEGVLGTAVYIRFGRG